MKSTTQKNRTAAESTQNIASPIPTARFVDLAVFVVAYQTYQTYLAETGSESDTHLKKGLTLIKRYHEDLISAIQQVYDPITERPDAGSIRNPLNLALRATTPSEIGISHWAKSIREVFPWVKRHPTMFGDLFTGRAARAARELASIVDEENSASLLNKLATIAPVSGLTITRKWTEAAAQRAGVPLTPTESTLVDAQVARGLGEDLGRVEASLSTVPTNTPEAADLQEQRADILQQIGKVAEQSPNPDTILAVAAQAKPTTQYATETGKKQGLTPEQEDAMMARGRVIIAAGAGSGKCIVGGTLVQTEKGLIPIENLCAGLDAEQDAVFETLVHGILGTEKTSHVYFDGFRQTRRVETTQGYELEGTAKHKILCLENGIVDWKYLQDIQVGDIVCLDRRPGLFATTPFQRTPDQGPPVRASGTSDTNVPLTLTPQVARLLGYIVSEGYIRKNVWNISLNTTDPEQMNLYRDSVQGIITHQEREDTRHRYQFILGFCRYADIQALMGFGLTREKAQEKEIPFGILQSPKHIITEFLKALFDGDGGVYGSTLGYCTASTKMAEQLHTLLLAYGIPARRRFRPNSGSGAWHIFITGKGLRRFASEIGFNLKYKQDKLEGVAARPENTNVDVIPSISHICRAVKDQYKAQYGTSKTDDPWHGTAKCIVNGSRNPSYTSLATFLEFYRVATPEWAMLDKLCKDEWFFDSIVEVAESEAHVYDFVVPGTHSFSAGGFINHNTRVIASKVAYHINELGQPASSILATSFTRKASAELIKRCGDYGAVIQGNAADGFGTTHAIAGGLLNKKAPNFKRPNYLGKKEGWKQATIFRLAMDQVKMRGVPQDPPDPKGFWDDLMKSQSPSQSQGQGTPQLAPGTSPVAPPPPSTAHSYLRAVDDTLGYYRWAANTWSGGPASWAQEQIPWLQKRRNVDPSQLTDREKAWMNRLFEKVKGRQTIQYRVAAGRDQGFESPDNASEPEDWRSQVLPEPKQRQNKMESYTYHKQPANQWFNLGRELVEVDSKGNKKPLPMGEFRRAVSILKGKAISPSQAWAGEGGFGEESDHAAVYAAYEWIKGNNGEPEFAGSGDMDDLLLDTVSALIGSPNLRQQIQSQYKVLLVDEAQDLNKIQHVLFGLMAGYLDPKTLEPWEDKHMTADTFSMIGDDFQCVEASTLVRIPGGGSKKASQLVAGDKVLSYRNGVLVAQTVRHTEKSDWGYGYAITTESGCTLTMSPNHKLWATEPQTEDHQITVYLMYRRDMGYRVGVTNKGKISKDGEYLNSYGGRCFSEKAERLWVLDICEDRDEALTKELQYSLRYSIPTAVFCGETRGLNQDRIDTIFQEFGHNGAQLLRDKHLSQEFPHWMSQSFTKHGRERHTIQLTAHGSSNTNVTMEWSGDKFDTVLEGMGVVKTPEDRRRLRRWFANYREALIFAKTVEKLTTANLSHRLSLPSEGVVRQTTASGLHVGMRVPVLEKDSLVLDRIVSIEKKDGVFLDLDVDDASNFFGNNILTSNSIYEFRGANPAEFIDKSDLTGSGGDFKTKMLDTNFRSGEAIVQAANKLIAHNTHQIPKVCKANTERNGQGSIIARPCDNVEDAAETVAEEIEGSIESSLPDSAKYKNFGVAVRSNAEAYQYGVAMLKKGIPFKCNVQFFNDNNTKALIGWLTIAEKGLDGDPNLIEDAVRDAVKAPFSNLGPAFFGNMEEKARGPWARWLVDGGHSRIYAQGKWAGILQHFVNNIDTVAHFTGTPSELVNQILQLKGVDGSSMLEAMIRSVSENDDIMAELAAESDSGKVSDEQILEMATAPVNPLIGLMKGKENLGSAMTYVRKLRDVNSKVATKDTEDELDRDAVTIGTMHSWKGLEIPTMYIPIVGGKFPRTGKDGYSSETPELASERRLAYVAITRAEQKAVILDIPHPKHGFHSQFISEACIPLAGENLPDEDGDGADSVNKVASRWEDYEVEKVADRYLGWDNE